MTFWITLGLIAAALIAWQIQRGDTKKVRACLNRQAVECQGVVKSRWGIHALTFQHHGVEVLVSAMMGDDGGRTFAQIELDSLPEHRLIIRNSSAQALGDKWLGVFGETIRVGNPAFDGALVTQGTSPGFVRSVLSPEMQQRLLALSRRGPICARLLPVQRANGRKTLRVDVAIERICTEEADYHELVETTIAFYDMIRPVTSG